MTFTGEIISRLALAGVVLAALAVWELGVLVWPVRRSVKALAAAVVPGLGHCYAGRPGAGLGYFAVAVTSANAVIIGYTLWFGPAAQVILWIGAVALALAFITGLFSVLRLTVGRDPEQRALYRENLFREGVVLLMKGRFTEAGMIFGDLVSWDHRDYDAWFYRGLTSRYEAEAMRARAREYDKAGKGIQSANCRRLSTNAWRKALSHYRRCIQHDVHGKWMDEIAGELEQVYAVSLPSGRLRAVSESEPDFTRPPSGPAHSQIQITDIAARKERLLNDIRNIQSRRR